MRSKNFLMKLSFITVNLFITINAFAEPPFITDDAMTTEYKHTELYLFNANLVTKGGVELFGPAVEYNYGLTKNLEFSFITGVLTERPSAEDEHNVYGISDLELELKYMFIKETKCRPAVAIVPTVLIPTGNHALGLGNGRLWYSLPLWVEKSWKKWTAFGGGGYAYNSAKEMLNFWYGGMVVQRELNDKWTVGGEIYSQSAITIDEKGFTLLNFGAIYILAKNVEFLFSVGNTIFGTQNFVSYIGLGFEWE